VTLRLLEDDAVAEPGSDGLRAVRPETPVRRPSDLDGVGVEVPGSSTSVGAASRFACGERLAGSRRLATCSWYVDGAIGNTRQIGSTP